MASTAFKQVPSKQQAVIPPMPSEPAYGRLISSTPTTLALRNAVIDPAKVGKRNGSTPDMHMPSKRVCVNNRGLASSNIAPTRDVSLNLATMPGSRATVESKTPTGRRSEKQHEMHARGESIRNDEERAGSSVQTTNTASSHKPAKVSAPRVTKATQSNEVNNHKVLGAVELLRPHLEDLMIDLDVDPALVAFVLDANVNTISQIRTRAN